MTLSYLVFATLVACTNSAQPEESLTETVDLQAIEKRLLMKIGNWNEFDRLLEDLTEPQDRDIVLLSIAVDKSGYASELCKRVQTKNAKKKCRQVLERPHLSSTR